MGLGFILIPSNLLGVYFQSRVNNELSVKFQISQDIFQKMLEAGDINITNPYQ